MLNVIWNKDVLAVVLALIALLGAAVFFLTGLVRVKDGQVVLLERAGMYAGLLTPGTYYFVPLLYLCAGRYETGINERKIRRPEGTYLFRYEIISIRQFHYVGHHDLRALFAQALQDDPHDLSAALKKRSEAIGLRFLDLRKITN